MNRLPGIPTLGVHDGEVGSDMLTTGQAARHLGLAVSTLNKWRVYGTGPSFIKLGRVRYRISDLDAYTASHRHLSTHKAQDIAS